MFGDSSLCLAVPAAQNLHESQVEPVDNSWKLAWNHYERARRPSAYVLYAPSSTATVLLGGGTDLMADLVQVLSEATELEQLLDPGTESRSPCCI